MKVKASISEKETIMKCVHEELEETNSAVEIKAKLWEDACTRVSEMQLAINSEDTPNEALNTLRAERDELESELKALREKKERLEPEKKKILKSIKIGNDYLELFGNNTESFEKTVR
jgi:uncharacterized protein (DUF4415 family)